MKITQLIDEQLEAYNNQDIIKFISYYTEDVEVVILHDKILLKGSNELHDYYQKLFLTHPQNRASIINRIIQGEYIIDQELIEGRNDSPPYTAVAIYKVKNDKIISVHFAR